MVSQCRYAFSRHSNMNLGSFFLAEIRWMTSSFRPRGQVSASISVTNPCLYSRLASSAVALVYAVAVGHSAGMALAIAGIVKKRLAEGQQHLAQADGRWITG